MKKAIIPLSIFILFVVSAIFYVGRFGIVTNIGIKGYVLSNNVMLKNLTNGKDEEKITYESVEVNDNLYKFGNRYYVGENRRHYVSNDFPIISTDASTLLVVNDVGNYIDEEFIKTKAYKDTIITNSHLYNNYNMEQVDNYNYYFLEMNNGIFINTTRIKLYVYNEIIDIPTNSYIYFSENSLCYYYLNDARFVYDEVPVIDSDNKVNVGKYDISYKELLINLKIKDKDREDIIVEDNTSLEIDDKEDEVIEEPKDEKVTLDVKVNDINAGVYSIKGNISIIDDFGVIVKNPTIELKVNGNLFLRKTVEKGDFILEGLSPDTEYEVKISYIYKKDKQKVEKIIYNDKIKTDTIDNLQPLKLNVDNIKSSVDNISFEGIKLLNNLEDEALYGVKSITLKVNDKLFTLSPNDRKELLNINSINYEIDHVLKSNTRYDVEFVFKDVDNNIMNVENSKYSVITKKSPSIGKIETRLDKNFKRVALTFICDNVDDVLVDNYKYVVYDESGLVVSSGSFLDSKYFVELDNLDSAVKYNVKLYTSYFDTDGTKVEDLEIASTDFITYDINKLGDISFEVKDNIKDGESSAVSSTSASFYISYTNYDSENIIYSLLDDEVKLQVINNDNEDVVKEYTFDKYDFVGVGVALDIDGLNSFTSYRIEVKPVININGKTLDIRTNYLNNKFKTLKLEPTFNVVNLFIADGYIDFDAIIYDKDKAIVENDSQLSVYDENGERVYTQILDNSRSLSNGDNYKSNHVNISKLDRGKKYTFKVTVNNYDNGYRKFSDVVINNPKEYILSGINGNILIDKVIKTSFYNAGNNLTSGINLFDINNMSRWKINKSGNSVTANIFSHKDDNSIVLRTTNGYSTFSYYVPELINQRVTVSFLIKSNNGDDHVANDIQLCNGGSWDTNKTTLSNIAHEYGNRFSFTIKKLSTNGYISFNVLEGDSENNTTEYEIKELTITLGNGNEYIPFIDDNSYTGLFNINLDNPQVGDLDLAHYANGNISELLNNHDYQYYLRLKCEGNNCKDDFDRYSLDNFGLPLINKLQNIELSSDCSYVVYLSAYDSEIDRYYDFDNIEFDTSSEVRTIKNFDEFLAMHPYGNYIAIDDIYLYEKNSYYTNIFNGTLDLRGHSLFLGDGYKLPQGQAIYKIGSSGIVKNAVLHVNYKSNDGSAFRDRYGLFRDNYGTVSNLMVYLDDINDAGNIITSLIGYYNHGIIENFVIKTNVEMIGVRQVSLGCVINSGIIKNGYIYGKDIHIKYVNDTGNSRQIGAVVGNNVSGQLKNIYSLVNIKVGNVGIENVDCSSGKCSNSGLGNIVGTFSNSTISNCYSYNTNEDPLRPKTVDPLFTLSGGKNYSDLYYASKDNYSELYSKKIDESYFSNVDFQNKAINTDNMFLVDEAWKASIFPQLKMPEFMPVQEYIPLPKAGDVSEVDFLSVDKIDYLENDVELNKDLLDDGYTTKITLSIKNPDNLYIDSLSIDGFNDGDVKVLPQGANVDVNTHVGLYEVLLKEPSYYGSKYKLNKMGLLKGTEKLSVSFNDEYLEMDLYKKVYNIKEINDITKAGTGTINFKLMNDIDYGTESNKTFVGKITGKLDGNNHVIRNINNTHCLLGNVDGGTVKNFVIDNANFVTKPNTQESVVCYLHNGGTVDNITVSNVEIDATANRNGDVIYLSGLVAVADSSEIMNSSVTNLKIRNVDNPQKAYIGGIVGYSNNNVVKNVYSRKIDVNVTNDTGSVGGVIGLMKAGTLSNAFATGKIVTECNYTGGITGTSNNGNISSVISKVDIIGRDYLGGIVGETSNLAIGALSLGDLTTKQSNSDTFHRGYGNNFEGGLVYAWDNQLINSVVSSDNNGEILLSSDDLLNRLTYVSKIGLSSSFILDSNFVSGYIPMLYSTRGEILKVVDDDKSDLEIAHKLPFKFLGIKYELIYDGDHPNDVRYATGINVSELKFENPDNNVINDIKIDGLEIEEASFHAITNNNITTVSFVANPTKFYDSYLIKSIVYNNDNEFDASIKITASLFGKINNVSDWNNVAEDDAQNYIITRDISFGGSTNIKTGLTFNRLVGISNVNNISISNIGSENNKFVLTNQIGFINNVITEISHINFKNIYLTTDSNLKGSYSYLCIFKSLNGTMNNVNFKDIYIINNGTSGNYTAIIGYNYSPDIRNINLNNITVKGKDYVGSLVAYSNDAPKTNVVLRDINVSGNNYVGGLLGYELTDAVNNKIINNFYIEGDNITVNGSDYVGGMFGRGSGVYIYVYNSTITGRTYVGGILGDYSTEDVHHNFVIDSYISGNKNLVGGICGHNSHLKDSYVVRTTIDGLNTADNVGGISGSGGYGINRCGVIDSHVINGKTKVGGIKGQCGYCTVENSFVYNTEVSGGYDVGGAVGYSSGVVQTLQYLMIQADITATIEGAGGFSGRATNATTTTSNNMTRIFQCINANSKVVANNKAGGLIGYIENDLFEDHFKNNIISGSVSCYGSNCKAGYLIGFNDKTKIADSGYENMKNWLLYNGTMLNDVKVGTLGSDTRNSIIGANGKIVDRNFLATYSKITGTIGTDKYVNNPGYFPSLAGIMSEYQRNFELPNDTANNNLLTNSLMSTSSNRLITIPKANVYASDVDKINITFDSIDNYVNLMFKVNDGEYIKVNQKTYTMYYDFSEDVILTIKNGLNEQVYVYTKEDLVNSSTIVEDNYYHLNGNTVESNSELKVNNSLSYNDYQNRLLLNRNRKYVAVLSNSNINNAVNIYGDKILLSDKNIYDISSGDFIENHFTNFELVDTKALHEYEYDGNVIKTYNNYSTINDNVVNKILLFNNKLDIIKNSLSMDSSNILSSSYNGNDYLVYVDSNNRLVSLKDPIKYPKDFKNYNIKSIRTNNNYMLVEYTTKDYIVFNYVSGDIIGINMSYKPSLEEYIKDYFSNLTSPSINNNSEGYKNAKEVVSKLHAKSVDEVLNQGNDNREYIEKSNYSIVYDNMSKEYDIYELPIGENNASFVSNIVEDNKLSDTIKNNPVLLEYYSSNSKKVNVVSSMFIMVPIIGVIVLVIFILRRYFINKKVEIN